MSKLEEFIEKAKKIHGDIYDYSSTQYINSRTKVKIVCYEHGEFEQNANSHIQKRGCPSCGKIKNNEGKKLSQSEFIEKAQKIHGIKYDYSKVEYLNFHTKVIIECSLHGDFEQTPANHLSKQGCIKCKETCSFKEKEVSKFLESLDYKFITSDRSVLNGKELDILIPDSKLAIEFNGEYWHYHKDKFRPGYHAQKSKMCKEKGIRLLHIREDLWNSKNSHMKEVIIKFLNKNKCLHQQY